MSQKRYSNVTLSTKINELSHDRYFFKVVKRDIIRLFSTEIFSAGHGYYYLFSKADLFKAIKKNTFSNKDNIGDQIKYFRQISHNISSLTDINEKISAMNSLKKSDTHNMILVFYKIIEESMLDQNNYLQ